MKLEVRIPGWTGPDPHLCVVKVTGGHGWTFAARLPGQQWMSLRLDGSPPPTFTTRKAAVRWAHERGLHPAIYTRLGWGWLGQGSSTGVPVVAS